MFQVSFFKKICYTLAALFLFSLSGCYKDEVAIRQRVKVMTPEYMDYSTFRASFKAEAPRALSKPGKIYAYKNLLLINEIEKGIHVIDKSNPSNPIPIAFLNLPGNIDFAVRGNYLYADSYIDLVVMDIGQPAMAREVGRVQDAFPYPTYSPPYQTPDPQKGVPIAWQEKEIEIEVRPGRGEMDIMPLERGNMASEGLASRAAQGALNGKGGSMARFTLYKNYLYTVDRQNLQVFDLAVPNSPNRQSLINVGFDIETIFPAQEHLFIGSQEAMYIYGLNQPAAPRFVSKYTHIRSCDPVAVWGEHAYVTLRAGNTCRGGLNQLEVISIKNLESPRLTSSYPMQEPFGLGADENLLFVCDNGLKVYNSQKPDNLILLKHYASFKAYDVIPNQGELLVSANEGVYLYQYTDSGELTLMSEIKAQP
jgi:hypothetical protein